MSIDQLVSAITLKILLAIVIAVAMIISVFFLSQDLHAYLGKLENGDLLQLVSFGVLCSLSGIGMYYLLREKRKEIGFTSSPTSIMGLFSCDIQVLGIKFIEGFLTGLTKETGSDPLDASRPNYKKGKYE